MHTREPELLKETFANMPRIHFDSCDVLIVDTAGRLQNKSNLMNELSKMRKVIDREAPGC